MTQAQRMSFKTCMNGSNVVTQECQKKKDTLCLNNVNQIIFASINENFRHKNLKTCSV